MHAVFGRINRKRQWYEQPTLGLKMLNLLSLRLDLRDLNLFDAGSEPMQENGEEPPPGGAEAPASPDGHWNDLHDPDMGSTDSAFSRNINPRHIRPEKPPRLHDPSARDGLARADDAATSSSRPPRSTSSPPPGSSSRTTTGSSTAAARPRRPSRSRSPRATTGPRTRCTCAGRCHARRRQRRAGRRRRRQRQRERQGRRLRQHRDPLVGRLADLRVEQGAAGRGCARFEDGKLKIGDDGRLPEDPDQRGRRPHRASTRTGGSASPACTRCSPRSTTRSATCSRRRTRAGTTSACSTPPGSSTRR